MQPQERANWLEERRKGIGSSDAPAILGHSPDRSALHVYLEKIGELQSEDNEAKMSGRMLEDYVAARYQERTGNPVYKPSRPIWWSKHYPWMFCSLDRLSEEDNKGIIVELKTSRFGEGWGQDGTDEVTAYCYAQVQEQIATTNINKAHVALVIGGQELRIYYIERNEPYIATMVPILKALWDRVEARDAPAYDWTHPATADLVKARLPQTQEGLCKHLAGAQVECLIRQYLESKESKGQLEKFCDRTKAQLLEMLGTAETGITASGYTIKAKDVTRKAYTAPEASYKMLTVKAPREK
jgi:putative phage-type endonuclease